MGAQPQRHALGQRDIALLSAFGRGEGHPGAEDADLPADVHHAVQEVHIVYGQPERLARPQPEPGPHRCCATAAT